MMTHVDEPRLFHPQLTHESDGVVNGLMCGMFLMPQSIDYHIFHSLQKWQFCVGNRFHVSDVSKILYAESHDGQLSMHHSNGHDSHVIMPIWTRMFLHGCQFLPYLLPPLLHRLFQIDRIHRFFFFIADDDGYMRFHLYQVEGWHPRITFFLGCKAIRDALHQVVSTEFLRIHVHITKNAVRTQIIQATHMVIMLMGDEHRIEGLKVYAKHLLAEIGAAVNKDAPSSHFHQTGAAQTLIFGVGRCADLTGATNLRHTT